jgi:hypothetical protein
MEYQGYEIAQDEDGTWRASVGDKVVAVGLSTQEVAQLAVDGRRRNRERLGLDPVG